MFMLKYRKIIRTRIPPNKNWSNSDSRAGKIIHKNKLKIRYSYQVFTLKDREKSWLCNTMNSSKKSQILTLRVEKRQEKFKKFNFHFNINTGTPIVFTQLWARHSAISRKRADKPASIAKLRARTEISYFAIRLSLSAAVPVSKRPAAWAKKNLNDDWGSAACGAPLDRSTVQVGSASGPASPVDLVSRKLDQTRNGCCGRVTAESSNARGPEGSRRHLHVACSTRLAAPGWSSLSIQNPKGTKKKNNNNEKRNCETGFHLSPNNCPLFVRRSRIFHSATLLSTVFASHREPSYSSAHSSPFANSQLFARRWKWDFFFNCF